MGIYIKGIEMPTRGFMELLIYPDGRLEYRDIDETIVRVPNAVSQVETPHGRLVDADAIAEKKWQAESEACFYALEDVVSVTDIDEASTAIEAEYE